MSCIYIIQYFTNMYPITEIVLLKFKTFSLMKQAPVILCKDNVEAEVRCYSPEAIILKL